MIRQNAVALGIADSYAQRFAKWFTRSAGVVFLITGLAKIVSVFGTAKILELVDPIFGISFRHLLLLAGIVELAVSQICLLTTKQSLKLGLIASLATGITVYRAGLWYLGWRRPCSCMGSLTDALRISPATADFMMKLILAFLLIGSCLLAGFPGQRQRSS